LSASLFPAAYPSPSGDTVLVVTPSSYPPDTTWFVSLVDASGNPINGGADNISFVGA
jgi:hypothetical protein